MEYLLAVLFKAIAISTYKILVDYFMWQLIKIAFTFSFCVMMKYQEKT